MYIFDDLSLDIEILILKSMKIVGCDICQYMDRKSQCTREKKPQSFV